MRLFTTSVVLSIIALTACTPELETSATPAPTASATASVVAPLIGKRLVGDNITFIINADGTMSGTARGEAVVGTYEANAKETCSTYTAPAFLTGREFCSTPLIKGNTVVFNRRDGSQSQVYTIKG